MWLIGVEVEQKTNAPLLKKILDPPLTLNSFLATDMYCSQTSVAGAIKKS